MAVDECRQVRVDAVPAQYAGCVVEAERDVDDDDGDAMLQAMLRDVNPR